MQETLIEKARMRRRLALQANASANAAVLIGASQATKSVGKHQSSNVTRIRRKRAFIVETSVLLPGPGELARRAG